MGAGTTTPGPYLHTLATDEALGVIEDDSVGFFAVVTPEPPPQSVLAYTHNYGIGGVVNPSAGPEPRDRVRWLLYLEAAYVPPNPPHPESWGWKLTGFVGGGGGSFDIVAGTSLLCHPFGMTLVGDTFDVAFTYNSAVLKIYVNGQLEAQGSPGSMWGETTRTGRFQLGAVDMAGAITGGWMNHHGGIGMAMLTVDGDTHVRADPEPAHRRAHRRRVPRRDHPRPARHHPHRRPPPRIRPGEPRSPPRATCWPAPGPAPSTSSPSAPTAQVLVADSTEPTGLALGRPDRPDTARQFFAQQHGPLPATPESSGMYRVPYLAGAVVEYTLERASLHLGEAGSTATTLMIEKSETTDEFTPITIATLTLGSGVFLDEETSGLGTIESGNLLRFTWTAIGTGADMFHAQLEGTET